MAPFAREEIDWRRIDVTALVTHGGIATVSTEDRDQCVRWLHGQGYETVQIDLGRGFREVLHQIGDLFHWSEQFGYSIEDGAGDLNAIRDGFDFEIPNNRSGMVLELVGADSLWSAERAWTAGFLSIACEHSRYHLAIGERFFSLLVLPTTSPLIGAVFDEVCVPYSGWKS